MRLTGVAGLACLCLTAPACTTAGGGPAPAASAATPAATGPAAGVPGLELRATSATMETWALLYEPPPWRPGQEVKVVWRSTGTGELRAVAVGPRGQRVAPSSGPTPHVGSNWARPGDEWGTSFRLDEPGRWTLRVDRGAASASLTLAVAP